MIAAHYSFKTKRLVKCAEILYLQVSQSDSKGLSEVSQLFAVLKLQSAVEDTRRVANANASCTGQTKTKGVSLLSPFSYGCCFDIQSQSCQIFLPTALGTLAQQG